MKWFKYDEDFVEMKRELSQKDFEKLYLQTPVPYIPEEEEREQKLKLKRQRQDLTRRR